MKITPLPLKGLLLLEPLVHGDERGHFFEAYNERELSQFTPPPRWVQENQSLSQQGVLRGLHCQLPPQAQTKLVRVLEGEIWDVAVDLRANSPSLGQHHGEYLSAANRRQLYIPQGFAHGFLVISPQAVVQYKVDAFWAARAEAGLRYDDPALGIPWPRLEVPLVLNAKDQAYGPWNGQGWFL